jgi:hypothetical protein
MTESAAEATVTLLASAANPITSTVINRNSAANRTVFGFKAVPEEALHVA